MVGRPVIREWLRRASEDDSGYVPWRFSLVIFNVKGFDLLSIDEEANSEQGARRAS